MGKERGGNFETAKIRKKRGVEISKRQKIGNKKRGGDVETPKIRKQKEGWPIDRGFNGSYFNTSKGRGLEMGGNVESQKRNKKGDGNIEIQKNGKKRGVGLLRHRKNQ
jgi:hypothetical protein